MKKIGINGFGRIGRNFLRTILADQKAKNEIPVVAINIGPASPEAAAHLLKYDSLLGTYPGTIELQDDSTLVVDGDTIDIYTACDPGDIPWKKYDIDWVVESSGQFTKADQAKKHIDAGAKKVLISAPAKGEDVSIVPGVNDEEYDEKNHHIVSLGSCTTNAFLPLIKVLLQELDLQSGFMTTIHAYTNSQVLLDTEHDDLRRARAAAINIIPTTTGASKLVDTVFPKLKGRIKATAIRVPVAKISLIDFVFETSQNLTKEHINSTFEKASNSYMKGIVGMCYEPLVSSDFSEITESVVIDSLMTEAIQKGGKIFGWYDNEWAYSVRLKDFLINA